MSDLSIVDICLKCGNLEQCSRAIATIIGAYRKEGDVWDYEDLQLFRDRSKVIRITVKYPGTNPVEEVCGVLECLAQGVAAESEDRREFQVMDALGLIEWATLVVSDNK